MFQEEKTSKFAWSKNSLPLSGIIFRGKCSTIGGHTVLGKMGGSNEANSLDCQYQGTFFEGWLIY